MGAEKCPRFRDMFHDKLFCHRFFTSHNVKHPKLVAEVENHQILKQYIDKHAAPKKLIWKPRYSTMSLGVEHFDGGQNWDKPSPISGNALHFYYLFLFYLYFYFFYLLFSNIIIIIILWT